MALLVSPALCLLYGSKRLFLHCLLKTQPRKGRTNYAQNSPLLRQYLQATRPIICLTYSKLVSSAAIGAIQQKNGPRRGELLTNILGTLILSKYDEDPRSYNDDNCYIIIPCIHPSAPRYDTLRRSVLIRLLHKTLAVAWIAQEEAAKFCGSPTLSKRNLCEQVMKATEFRVGIGTEFGRTFAKPKQEYLDLSTASGSDISRRRLVQRSSLDVSVGIVDSVTAYVSFKKYKQAS